MSTEAQKRASLKWQAKNMRRVPFDVRYEYYNDVLLPFTEKHGYTMRGFILEAVEHYMKYIEEKEGETSND